jgi:hypothetical protein
MRSQRATAFAVFAIASVVIAARPGFRISNDRELKEIDLAGWDCRDRPDGTAKTAEVLERNRSKNRSAPSLPGPDAKPLDTASFLKLTADFDAQTKNKRRKDLTPALRQQLEELEKQSVALTGYLVLAYAGPTETNNCDSVDFHDWHLELFEKPQDHAPQPGDPTPIVCEISPRTQNAIYRDGIRIQEMAAFFRRADLAVESTAHQAKQIRVTGYLLWDDDHNGKADVGAAIDRVRAKKYYQPWRSTAWEIHPVYKIDILDTASVGAAQPVPTPAPGSSPPLSATPRPQMATLTQPVKIKIPYGETTLPAGAKLSVVSRDAKTVTVRYMGGNYVIPIASTDLH